MAKKLKDYYDDECVKLLAKKINSAKLDFDTRGFSKFLEKELPDKEFLARQDVFVTSFEKFLFPRYDENIRLFHKILGPELATTTGMFTQGWWLWPVGRYVEKHGVENVELSLDFIYELTKRFTGEFAIRPLLEKDPKKVLLVMLKWSKDRNVHVRRLASEGGRIRLPWAKKSSAALQEFVLYKKILSNLKNDKEKFVQKSVGNNLNDLMKEDKKKALEVISEWKRSNPGKETSWIIKHGTRSVRKKRPRTKVFEAVKRKLKPLPTKP